MKSLFDLFISYGRKESRAFAMELHAQLLAQGLSIWFDQKDIPPSVDYQKQIDDGIERARNFIFIIAPHSARSPYCRLEIEHAVRHGKRIIPLYHVALGESEVHLHPTIQRLNWLYFDGSQPYEEAFSRLLATLQQEAEYVELHTFILNQALAWAHNQRKAEYLLTDDAREHAEAWLQTRFSDGQRQPPCLVTALHAEFICESTKSAFNDMSWAFISYAKSDGEWLQRLCARLQHEGITVWHEELQARTSADTLREELQRGIEKADNVIFLASPASSAMVLCRAELEYAQRLSKRIILLNLGSGQATDIKNALVLDWREAVEDTNAADGLDKLLRALYSEASYYRQHKELLVNALKWQSQNHNASVLLHGRRLTAAEAWLKGAPMHQKHPPLPLHIEYIEQSLAQPRDAAREIFLAYASADRDFARRLHGLLETQGKSAWFDQESADWLVRETPEEMRRGIAASHNFLFVVSPQSLASTQCRAVMEDAIQRNKRVIPLLRAPVEDVPAPLRGTQWIDFTRTSDDFYKGFSELIRTLDTDREHVEHHTRWGLRAQAWADDGYSVDLLLRGNELAMAHAWLDVADQQRKQPAPAELHRKFITASAHAVAARKRMEWRIRVLLHSLLVISVIALIVAIALFFDAQNNRQRAEHNARAFHTQHLATQSLLGTQAPSPINGGSDQALLLAALAFEMNTANHNAAANLGYVLSEQRYLHHYLAHLNQMAYDMDYSPDKNLLAITAGQEIRFLMPTNAEHTAYQLSPRRLRNAAQISTLCFTPDGRRLLSGDINGTIQAWDMATFQPSGAPIVAHRRTIGDMVFSVDGQWLITAGYDGEIHLRDRQSLQKQHTLSGHSGEIYELDANPINPAEVLSASADGSMRIWDLHEQRQTQQVLLQSLQAKPTAYQPGVNAVVTSPDGTRLAMAGDVQEIFILDKATLQTIHVLRGHTQWVNKLSFSRDSRYLLSASADKTMMVWDVAGGYSVAGPLRGHAHTVVETMFTPTQDHLISLDEEGHAALWSLQSTPATAFALEGHNKEVESVVFHPHRNLLASAGDDAAVLLWPLDTAKPTPTRLEHGTAIAQLVFSRDGQRLLGAGQDGHVRMWDWQKNKELAQFSGRGDALNTIDISPDGQWIAAGGRAGVVYLWNATDPSQPVTELQGHSHWVRRVKFSPVSNGADGAQLASCDRDGGIFLWHLAQGKTQGERLSGHRDWVNDLIFTPDGRHVISAADDRSIVLWDTHTMQPVGEPLLGHTDWVYSLAAMPTTDGSLVLASGSDDKTIILWQINGTDFSAMSQPIRGHGDAVRALSFSANQKYLASAGGTTIFRILVWNLDADFWIRTACRLANRNLTVQEWQTFAGNDANYHKICPDLSESLEAQTPGVTHATP